MESRKIKIKNTTAKKYVSKGSAFDDVERLLTFSEKNAYTEEEELSIHYVYFCHKEFSIISFSIGAVLVSDLYILWLQFFLLKSAPRLLRTECLPELSQIFLPFELVCFLISLCIPKIQDQFTSKLGDDQILFGILYHPGSHMALFWTFPDLIHSQTPLLSSPTTPIGSPTLITKPYAYNLSKFSSFLLVITKPDEPGPVNLIYTLTSIGCYFLLYG